MNVSTGLDTYHRDDSDCMELVKVVYVISPLFARYGRPLISVRTHTKHIPQ